MHIWGSRTERNKDKYYMVYTTELTLYKVI